MRVIFWTHFDPIIVQEAADCLRHGGLVVYPTDTLYGLGADATNDTAVRRLFQAKSRPLDSPLPIMIADQTDLPQVAGAVPPLAIKLGAHFWPGPLTLVLPTAPHFRSLALAGGDSVAVRVPAGDFARAVIWTLGGPITGTSANVSGRPPPTTAQDAVAQLGDKVDIVVDGGSCQLGVESTVIDLRGVPWLLREGAVSRSQIESISGPLTGSKE